MRWAHVVSGVQVDSVVQVVVLLKFRDLVLRTSHEKKDVAVYCQLPGKAEPEAQASSPVPNSCC